MWWCSTPARCGRTPTTSSTAISATWCRGKQANPDMQIAVGGCLAQKDREHLLRKAPWVDVVFGTHNIGSLPAPAGTRPASTAWPRSRSPSRCRNSPPHCLPARESAYAAWVSISVGCNNTCTFCIVPSLRGKEVDRRPADILAEVHSLVDQGVLEITLLGQNVNAYGVSFSDPNTTHDRGAFASLLRSCGDIDGLERVRFTSPTRQSSPTTSSRPWRRPPTSAPHCTCRCSPDPTACCGRCDGPIAPRSTSASSIGCAPPCRTRRSPPTSSSASRGKPRTTSPPPSTWCAPARFAGAFTFQYSKRPGTPAAELDGQLPKAVVQERYLTAAGGTGADLLGRERRTDRRASRVAGGHRRGPQGRQHRPDERTCARRPAGALPPCDTAVRPGDIVTTTVTGAAPHHLIADAPLLAHRRTRAGDAHAAGQRPRTVGLGLPAIGGPTTDDQATTGCA